MPRALLLALLLLLAVVPAAVSAGGLAAIEKDAEVHLDAEHVSYDRRANTVHASGHVVITRGDTEVRADDVIFNQETNIVEAQGHVVVTNAEGVLNADSVRLNMDDETGALETAEVRSDRYQYSLWGDRVEKGLGQSYHIENGRFTTCRCSGGKPSWSIRGDDLRVTMGGYAKLRGGTFNVLDVPVIYLPRALFPVQTERQSGFLMPRFGASNRRGFQAVVPFYWAIDKSQDLTFAPDVETSARLGAVAEYRYALNRNAHGLLDASYFNESIRGARSILPSGDPVPEHRWSVGGEHVQRLSDGLQVYADGFVVSDDLFLREINTYAFDHTRDTAIRTLPFTRSRVGLVQLWDRAALQAEAIYSQNLTGIQSDANGQTVTALESETLQRVPEVSLTAQQPWGEWALGTLNATAADLQRARGTAGVRLDVEPAVAVPLPLGSRAFGLLRAGFRETAYHLTDTRPTHSGTLVDLPQDTSRELPRLDAQLGTTVSRIYPMHWLGLEQVKHTIEPMLEYLYLPTVGQDSKPLFDEIDRFGHRNMITYGVVSRLLGKFGPSEANASTTADATGAAERPPTTNIRELARLSLAQSADLSREIDPLQSNRAADHFSDIDIAARVNPSRYLSLRAQSNYDTGTTTINAARVGLFVEDPRQASDGTVHRLQTRTSAGISYRFLTQGLLEEIDSNVVVRITDWSGLLYSSRYDLLTNRFLDNHFGLRLLSTCDCWALDLAVTDRSNPQEIEVRAQLTLVGLGSSTRQQSRVAALP